MTTTFYIDANRQNASNKSQTNKNEWEYKLGEGLQLPQGTEIAIADTFINKKGLNGDSIEIEEDIDEVISFMYYLTDNPHYVPRQTFMSSDLQTTAECYKPSFMSHGKFYTSKGWDGYNADPGDQIDDNDPNWGTLIGVAGGALGSCGRLAQNSNARQFSKPNLNQRLDFFRMDRSTKLPLLAMNNNGGPGSGPYNKHLSGDAGNDKPKYAPMLAAMDSYLLGQSETPMFACKIDLEADYTSNADWEKGETGGIYWDSDPVTGDRAMSHNGNSYDIPAVGSPQNTLNTVLDRLIRPIVGKVEIFIPKGVYSVNEIADLIDGQMNGKYLASRIKEGDFYTSYRLQQQNEGTFDGTLANDTTYKRVEPFHLFGADGQGGDYYNDGLPMGSWRNNMYMKHPADNGPAQPTLNGGQVNREFSVGPNMQRTEISPGALPWGSHFAAQGIKDQAMFLPVHRFRRVIEHSKYLLGGGGMPDNEIRENRRLNRYGFQTRMTYDDKAPMATTFNGNIATTGPYFTQANKFQSIGMMVKTNVNCVSDFYLKTEIGGQFKSGVFPESVSYDVMRKGYYIGTPDLSFTYDSTNSGFTFEGLHQSCRIPSVDMRGNPMDNEGSEAAFLRRVADNFDRPQNADQAGQLSTTAAENLAAPLLSGTALATTSKKQIISALNQPQQRLGGISVFNWAINVARKYGDVDINEVNPATGIRKYNPRFQELWKYQDYFSTPEKAKEAWNNTLWAKLGFTYDNLQNDNSWEKVKIYDLPNDGSPDSLDYWNSDLDVAPQHRPRGYVKPETDFVIYGKTTTASLDASAGPQISTVFNGAGSFNYAAQNAYRNTGQYDPHDAKVKRKNTYNPNPNAANPTTFIRTYDNHDVGQPTSAFCQNFNIINAGVLTIAPSTNAAGGAGLDYGDSTPQYINSMYRGITMVPINTSSRQIVAERLPTLSQAGYYIITSDIVAQNTDYVKESKDLPLLGVVPISNLTNQDFITTKNDIVHTLSQAKTINSIRIKILKPDLKAPVLEDNSSVILRITMPIPQTVPGNNPLQADQESFEDKKDIQKQNTEQPSPLDKDEQKKLKKKNGKSKNTKK